MARFPGWIRKWKMGRQPRQEMKGDLSWVVIAGTQKEEWAGRLLSREAGGHGDGRIWKGKR